MKRRQIFGISGNFFRDVWHPPLLQRHLLSLTDSACPRICYIGAANGDNPNEIESFYASMNRQNCRPEHFNIFWPCTTNFLDYFMGFDILYVGGGSTRNLINLFTDFGLDGVFRSAWDAGVVLSGTSAGAICWFEGCITDSLPHDLRPLRCFGFLPGSHCTHYDVRPDRPAKFRHFLRTNEIPYPGLATDNDVAVHYVEHALHECVAQRQGARAVLYAANGDRVEETDLSVRLLG